jgi:hypothetical protein
MPVWAMTLTPALSRVGGLDLVVNQQRSTGGKSRRLDGSIEGARQSQAIQESETRTGDVAAQSSNATCGASLRGLR